MNNAQRFEENYEEGQELVFKATGLQREVRFVRYEPTPGGRLAVIEFQGQQKAVSPILLNLKKNP